MRLCFLVVYSDRKCFVPIVVAATAAAVAAVVVVVAVDVKVHFVELSN